MAFDPKTLQGSHVIKAWEPGKRILLSRRWNPMAAGCGAVFSVFFAVGMGYAFYENFHTVWPGIGLTVFVVFMMWLAMRPHWTEYDFRRQRWTFARGGSAIRIDAKDVRLVEVGWTRYEQRLRNQEVRVPSYHGTVSLVHESDGQRQREELFSTPSAIDLESRRPLAVPFAEELARLIDRPCLVSDAVEELIGHLDR